MSQLETLSAKYGPPKNIICPLPTLHFPPVRERNEGEVCMCILRPNGRFLLQTKQSYPGQVMRLPSGGIQRGENVDDALLREIWEETNLTVHVERFLARICYESGGMRARFCTYMFMVREIAGELRSNDPDEKITDWREALPQELPGYADALRRMQPSWKSWGIFRAAALDTLFQHCGDLKA